MENVDPDFQFCEGIGDAPEKVNEVNSVPEFPNPGLRHVVLTYPETGPCMPFLFVGS